MRGVKLIITVVLLLFISTGQVWAQDMPVPVSTQWAFFQKILSFQRSLVAKERSEPVLAIVYQSKFRSSLNVRNELMAILDEQKPKIGGITLRVVEIDLTKEENIEVVCAAYKVNLVYIAPLRAFDITSILQETREKKILTLSGIPAYVTAGVSVGLAMKGDKPEILINRTAAQLEGSDFHAQLLKLVTIVY